MRLISLAALATSASLFSLSSSFVQLTALLSCASAPFLVAAETKSGEKDKPELPPVHASIPVTPFDAPKGSWTLVIIPDTQFYLAKFPDVYLRQTEWISRHKDSHNILFAAHEGDVTNNNSLQQWNKAKEITSKLNEGGVPYLLVSGNHDLGPGGKSTDRTTFMNTVFTPEDYANSHRIGLFEKDKIENSWHEVETPTGTYLIFGLEFGPRDTVLQWANEVAEQRPDAKFILVTHAYLSEKSTRDNSKRDANRRVFRLNPRAHPIAEQPGSANDGEDIWQKLVSKHKNFQMVLNGHIGGKGVGYLESTGQQGQKVVQMLVNFQDPPVVPARGYGGGGYLRLLQFLPDAKTVRVRTYSPWYDQWLLDPEHHFEFTLDN